MIEVGDPEARDILVHDNLPNQVPPTANKAGRRPRPLGRCSNGRRPARGPGGQL